MLLPLLLQVVGPQLATLSCPPRTQGRPTPNVQIDSGRYLLVVQSTQGHAQGMMQLSVDGTGRTGIDLRPVGIQVDTMKGVRVYPGNDSIPTTVLVGGTAGIGLTVYRLNAGGFDGTWGHVDPKRVSQDGKFCAFRALKRPP